MIEVIFTPREVIEALVEQHKDKFPVPEGYRFDMIVRHRACKGIEAISIQVHKTRT